MRVKPAIPGAIVRDPHSKRQLPAEGGDVPDSSFWIRRLRAGDVVIVAEPTPRTAPVTPLMTREETP